MESFKDALVISPEDPRADGYRASAETVAPRISANACTAEIARELMESFAVEH